VCFSCCFINAFIFDFTYYMGNYLSFSDYQLGNGDFHFVGLINYKALLKDPVFHFSKKYFNLRPYCSTFKRFGRFGFSLAYRI
ncbi:hypothetical protein OLQ24_05650, partial [Campylobacter jejuni]|nr:hypothetical protein [Campylobacter jejuni]